MHITIQQFKQMYQLLIDLFDSTCYNIEHKYLLQIKKKTFIYNKVL